MKLILIVSPELGWDSVVSIFDRDAITEEQYVRLEELCQRNDYILIDWKSTSSVDSFLLDYSE